jgi:hypothetical protein
MATTLAEQLNSLLRRYADGGQDENDQTWEGFFNDLRSLIAEYGPKAVNEALDMIPDGSRDSPSIH